MTTMFIALRNISRQKKRSILLGGAIAFGILIITLINSLTGGFVENVKENFSQIMAGHIFIGGQELTESDRTLNIIRDDTLLNKLTGELNMDIQYITKRSNTFATLIFGSKEMMQRIEGVDWSEESYFKNRLIITEGDLEGLSDRQTIILSSLTAEKLGVEVGETILARLQTVTGQQNVGEFKVVAVLQSTNMFGSMASYAHIDYLNELVNLKPGEFQSYNIFLNDMDTIDEQSRLLYKALEKEAPVVPRYDDIDLLSEDGQKRQERQMNSMFSMISNLTEDEEPWGGTKYSVITLNDMMAEVMAIMNVLNVIGLVVFLILLVIIMVGITNTFRMILVERTREIGAIRAIGMQRDGVRDMILLESLFIALCGTFGGLVLAFIVSSVLSFVSFGTNNPFFIFLNNGKLTFQLVPVSIIINIIIISITSLVAAYFPAQRAAELDPAKAIGTHY